MNVLVIGQGGREHAICWKLKQSPRLNKLFCAPGNGGIAELAETVNIQETDIDRLIEFAKRERIDLTVVGPENPLMEGIVDRFRQHDLVIFGPTQDAAIIEGSKSFAKHLMQKYNIPTAAYAVFDDLEQALRYLDTQQAPIVIKADGLAAGKGVVVAQTLEEARTALREMLAEQKFGHASTQVVIEEYLAGEELSLMAFVDGETVIPMVPAQDHKPVYDGDEGPNTGGMGAYSPVPQFGQELIIEAVKSILKPAAQAMVAEGRAFSGILYAGLMMTESGPKVIEFNARFGDPETQVVLPRLKTDLLDIIEAILNGTLDQVQVEWSEETVLSVVLAAPGYPQSYPKGLEIHGIHALAGNEDVFLFHAGTRHKEGKLVTSGGRVLNVTGRGNNLAQTREAVYAAISNLHFEGMHYRHDIGQKAFKQTNNQ